MNEKIISIYLDGVNCYLAESNGQFILFDTGGPIIMDSRPNSRREPLVKELQRAGCTPDNLKLIVLTHGDIDHVYNAAYLREKFNAKIAMHPGDLQYVEEPSIQTIMKNYKFRSYRHDLMSDEMQTYMRKFSLEALADFQRFSPDILIEDGFSLQKYHFDGEIIHIPGHTDGSIGILFGNGSFISGDIFSNATTAINASDFKVLDGSVEKLKKYSITTVYTGHSMPFDFKRLRA